MQELQIILTIILTFLIAVFTGIYTYATYRLYMSTKPYLESNGTRSDCKEVRVIIVNNAPHNIVVKDVYYKRIFRFRKFYRRRNSYNFGKTYFLIPIFRRNVYWEHVKTKPIVTEKGVIVDQRILIKEQNEIIIHTKAEDMRGRIKITIATSAGKCSTYVGGCLTGLSEEEIKKRGKRRWGFY